MRPAGPAAASPGRPGQSSPPTRTSKLRTAARPPLPGVHTTPLTSAGTSQTTPTHTPHRRPPPATGTHTRPLHPPLIPVMETNSHFRYLGALKNIDILLLISGIEPNPGPAMTEQVTIARININSITADTKLDELHQFVGINNVKILALTETKLDDTVADSLYSIAGFHAPLTKHRTRHGGV